MARISQGCPSGLPWLVEATSMIGIGWIAGALAMGAGVLWICLKGSALREQAWRRAVEEEFGMDGWGRP